MKRIILIFNAILLVSCQSQHRNEKLRKEVDSILDREFQKNELGGSILILKGENVVYQRNDGYADLETKEPITSNTNFNLGSISKTFVANGILILQERGLLSIEDSIYKYFEDFHNEEIAKSVKIKHLLSHTSGLPDIRAVRDNYDFYLTAKDEENFAPIKKVDSLNFLSGEKYEYSNPSFNGLALIIEKVTGERWQDFIIKNIFEPSEMTNSKITDGSYPEKDVAHAYVFYDSTFYEYDYGEVATFAAAGNGGVWSSANELAKYKLALQENKFLNKQLKEESRTVFYPSNWMDTIKPFIGYSWFTGQDFLFRKQHIFEVEFIYHTGSQGGFQSFYIEIPEKDILLVGLFNRPIDNYREIVLEINLLLEKYNWLV